MTALEWRCPRCKQAGLDADFACPACGAVFAHARVGGSEVADFLNATGAAGRCGCAEHSASPPCHIELEALRPPAPAAPAHHGKAKILRAFRSCRDKTILDVGCREAPIGRSLAGANHVIGIDRCARALVGAETNALGAGYRHLLIADGENLPLAGAQADVVLANDVLEHAVVPEKLVAEFQRVLKPGGELLVSVPNLVSYNNRLSVLAGSGVGLELHLLLKGRCPVNPISGARYPDQRQHLRFFTLKSLTRMLEDCGFSAVKKWGYDPVLSRMPFGDRLLRNWCLLTVVLARKV